MNKRNLRIGFAVLAFFLVSSMYAVSTSAVVPIEIDQTENVIVYAYPYEFSQFSYWNGRSYSTQQWASSVFNGLLRRESVTRAWVGELATDTPVISPSLTNFTFTLRDGLIANNGDPITADDVVFSYKVAMTPAINLVGYGALQQYMTNDSVVKIDNLTVRFDLASTYAFAFSLFNSPIVSEEHWGPIYADCIGGNATACGPDVWAPANGDGTIGAAGPFKFFSYDSTNDEFTVVRNDNYYRAAVTQADKIVYKYIAEKTAAIDALAAGTIDILDSQYVAGVTELIGLDVVDRYVGDPANQEISINHIHPVFGTGADIPDTGPNIVSTSDYTQARYVRKAFSHIADRDFYVGTLLEGLGQKAHSQYPSASAGYDPTVPVDPFNITKAKEFMEMAGYDFSTLTDANSDGDYETFFFSITTLAPNSNPARNSWSLNWHQNLAKIGVGSTYVSDTFSNVETRTFLWGDTTLVPTYANGGYDVFFVGNGWALDFDPEGTLTLSGSCETGSCGNFYNYFNGTLENIIGNYSSTIDFDARNVIASDMQHFLAENLPVIPLLYPQSHWGWNDQLTGIDGLLISTSGQNWGEVRKSSWELRVETVTNTETNTQTNTLTDTVTDTDIVTNTETNTATATDTVTATDTPISMAPVIAGLLGSIFVAIYSRRRRL